MTPSQGWRTEFVGGGFVTTPQDGKWSWGLELRSVSGERISAGESAGSADEHRLAFARSEGVYEWFVNHPNGLQQGWTITDRPSTQSGEALRVELGIRGDLRARVEATTVEFVDGEGTTAVTYGGLLAWDAEGRKLPVEFAALEDGIAIHVDDRGAQYPITIDPVAQQPT
ncbi:MAG: hypothetical protein WA771_13925 [Chthoniobacterales bacterium]